MKARTLFLLALAAPVLAGLCAAGSRLVSPPAFATLYSSVLGRATPATPTKAAVAAPIRVSQAVTPTAAADLSVDQFLRDDLTLFGQTVAVAGKPSCLTGAGCVLYDDGLKNAVTLNRLPKGRDQARLFTCDPATAPCVVVIHGLVVPDYDGSPALAVQSIAWRN
jgi:hypothetical protein